MTEARAPRELNRHMSTETLRRGRDGPAPRPSRGDPRGGAGRVPASSPAPTPWRRGAGPDAPATPAPRRRGGDEDDAGEDRRELEAREGGRGRAGGCRSRSRRGKWYLPLNVCAPRAIPPGFEPGTSHAPTNSPTSDPDPRRVPPGRLADWAGARPCRASSASSYPRRRPRPTRPPRRPPRRPSAPAPASVPRGPSLASSLFPGRTRAPCSRPSESSVPRRRRPRAPRAGRGVGRSGARASLP